MLFQAYSRLLIIFTWTITRANCVGCPAHRRLDVSRVRRAFQRLASLVFSRRTAKERGASSNVASMTLGASVLSPSIARIDDQFHPIVSVKVGSRNSTGRDEG